MPWERVVDGEIVRDVKDAIEWQGNGQSRLTNPENSDIIPAEQASFRTDELLEAHFSKHIEEYGKITKDQYVQIGREILLSPIENGEVEELTRSDGSVARYRHSTNDFVVMNEDGTIRTIFKPKAKAKYWEEEHERN